MRARIFLSCLWMSVAAAGIAGCASVPPPPTVEVSGNGQCHPSQDLPAHKTMKKLPEVETALDDFWSLFAGERKDHAADIRDYNSLYSQCVDATPSTLAK